MAANNGGSFASIFEFDTHEVIVTKQDILIDGKLAVHLAQPFRSAFWNPRGVIVDGVLYAYTDLLRIVNDAEEGVDD